MQRALAFKSAIVIIVILISVYLITPVSEKINLGLDLKGGIYLVYEVDTTKLPEGVKIEEGLSRALEIIRNRVDKFGVSEPSITRQGDRQIVVELPGLKDPQRAKNVIGKTALLEFKLVTEEQAPDVVPAGYELYTYKDERRRVEKKLLVEAKPYVTGADLKDARVVPDPFTGKPIVSLEFNDEGTEKFANVTAKNVGKKLAIVLDGKVQSAPVIKDAIRGGRAVIEGDFTDEEVKDLALVLRAGSLPVQLVLDEERAVGPTLGRDSIEKGFEAALLGLGLVVLFILIWYLTAGLVANISLMLCLLFLLAGLALFKATLTLPGIAGIVLTIGMSVDASVLIYERIKEELRMGKTLRVSILNGFDKAFSAIFDANITTIITAIILYNFGTGPIRGFAVTLTLGIIASLFSVLFVSKLILQLMTVRPQVKSLAISIISLNKKQQKGITR